MSAWDSLLFGKTKSQYGSKKVWRHQMDSYKCIILWLLKEAAFWWLQSDSQYEICHTSIKKKFSPTALQQNTPPPFPSRRGKGFAVGYDTITPKPGLTEIRIWKQNLSVDRWSEADHVGVELSRGVIDSFLSQPCAKEKRTPCVHPGETFPLHSRPRGVEWPFSLDCISEIRK